MIKGYKLILISALIIAAAVCSIVAGCSFNESYEDFLKKNNLTASVTYFLNEGEFNNHSRIKEINFKAGSKPYNMSQAAPESGSSSVAQLNGYTFLGWYEVALDADGAPLYDDNTPFDKSVGLIKDKTIQVTDVPFDFSKPLEENQHVYVCAKWQMNVKLVVKLLTEGFETLTAGETSYKTGDVIREEFIPAGGLGNLGETVFTAEGYSFVSFYTDETAGAEFTGWPITADDDSEDTVIYAKYLEGNWNVLREASDISALFASGGGRANYYLLKDIDCSDLSVRNAGNINNTGFLGTFKGNNHKISNLKIRLEGLRSGGKASLFGDIGSNAVIENVTFENLTANFTVMRNGDPSVFFMCTSIAEGATLTGVGIGGKMNITLGSGANVTETLENRWIFGGLSDDNRITGVTVLQGTECEITDSDGGKTTYSYNQNVKNGGHYENKQSL